MTSTVEEIKRVQGIEQGRSQDLVSGGAHPFRGGPDPLFFASDPKSQGSPLMYLCLPPDFGGGPGPPRPPPGYALGIERPLYRVSRAKNWATSR